MLLNIALVHHIAILLHLQSEVCLSDLIVVDFCLLVMLLEERKHVLLTDPFFSMNKIVIKCKCSVSLLQDLLMVTYLSNLTQAQIALNEKLVLL